MNSVLVDKKDDITMRLAHYFITEKNYTPVIVNGAKDEIWLQNQDGPFKIVRINANYIHNAEQFDYDILKINNVVHQIKRKTVSFSMNVLNILLDVNDDVKPNDAKNISSIVINEIDDVNQPLYQMFPDISEKLLLNEQGLDLLVNVTNDINKKTEQENKIYEKTFKEKRIVVTNLLVFINCVFFIGTYLLSGLNLTAGSLVRFGAVYAPLVKNGQIYRLLIGAFLHAGIIHLIVNMYSLYIIGTELETYLGKTKFVFVYFVSAIAGSLMSTIININTVSVGASGAIFGLLGSLIYFGYHYRLYLGSVLKSQILPLLGFNLLLGFILPGVDNAAHLGGLIAGGLATMAVGIDGKSSKNEKLNGIICLIIYLVFLNYVLFFR